MTTLFYAESRLPGTSRRSFLARWRAHGGLALESPAFREAVTRYVHHDPVDDLAAFPGTSTAYDALGEIACADPATLLALLTGEEVRGPIRADGARTFARTRTLEALVEEHALFGEPAPVSVAAFVAGAAAPADLAGALSDLQLRLTADGMLRELVSHLAVSPALNDDAHWGAFLQLGFANLSAAARAHRDWLPAFTLAAGPFITDLRVVASVRCPLYDPAALGV
ncbi:EthD domain-containing protein [Nocardioides carbamazepini]|uniref:EthD domain-containing protein n=1 Tax=Nocardioides carbamazepini TaxID=2854259 RepID=UPI002149DB89|nr:EthD domain-containing protein [Nocardioides carbamazepini]MCR1783692.1 EthD domain-containing protein [Nocardioides carbamazepini]